MDPDSDSNTPTNPVGKPHKSSMKALAHRAFQRLKSLPGRNGTSEDKADKYEKNKLVTPIEKAPVKLPQTGGWVAYRKSLRKTQSTRRAQRTKQPPQSNEQQQQQPEQLQKQQQKQQHDEQPTESPISKCDESMMKAATSTTVCDEQPVRRRQASLLGLFSNTTRDRSSKDESDH